MTDTVPQDTSLPDDVVERVARIAVDDLIEAHNAEGLDTGPYVYHDDDTRRVGIDGYTDMLRLVRVISAALKEAQA